MTVEVDLNEVSTFIHEDKFIQFLLNNSTNLNIPMFIIGTLEEKIKELNKQ